MVHADSAWLTFIAIVVSYLHSVFISCASPVSILWRECACLPACTKVSDECWCGCLSGDKYRRLHIMYCHTIESCFINIQNGLPFWSRITQFVLEKSILVVSTSCWAITSDWSASCKRVPSVIICFIGQMLFLQPTMKYLSHQRLLFATNGLLVCENCLLVLHGGCLPPVRHYCKEIWVSPKIQVLSSGTLSKSNTPDLENFATASWLHCQQNSFVMAVYYKSVNCNPLTPLLRFVVDLLYILFLQLTRFWLAWFLPRDAMHPRY